MDNLIENKIDINYLDRIIFKLCLNENLYCLSVEENDYINSLITDGYPLFFQGLELYFKKEYSTAIEYFKKSIEMKNSYAMNTLAICYNNELGVARNSIFAIELYQQSIQLNNSFAVNNLAHCYQNSLGVIKDIKKAFELFSKSASMGNPLAINNLAVCYHRGYGIERNIMLAIELYEQSIKLGYQHAKNNLQILIEAHPQEYIEYLQLQLSSLNFLYKTLLNDHDELKNNLIQYAPNSDKVKSLEHNFYNNANKL